MSLLLRWAPNRARPSPPRPAAHASGRSPAAVEPRTLWPAASKTFTTPADEATTISGPAWVVFTSPTAAGMATPSPMVGSSSDSSWATLTGQPGR